ncbi:uncharacterized protein [Patagioenas fasciata]|uniref:uncharacterized protein n=1 Tax=Patagioenas fasciata TaxID=372321 RepID=UPI003A998D05
MILLHAYEDSLFLLLSSTNFATWQWSWGLEHGGVAECPYQIQWHPKVRPEPAFVPNRAREWFPCRNGEGDSSSRGSPSVPVLRPYRHRIRRFVWKSFCEAFPAAPDEPVPSACGVRLPRDAPCGTSTGRTLPRMGAKTLRWLRGTRTVWLLICVPLIQQMKTFPWARAVGNPPAAPRGSGPARLRGPGAAGVCGGWEVTPGARAAAGSAVQRGLRCFSEQ